MYANKALSVLSKIAGAKYIPDPGLSDKLDAVPFNNPGLQPAKVYGSRSVYWLDRLHEMNRWHSYSRGNSDFSAKRHFEPTIKLLSKCFTIETKEHRDFDFSHISTICDSSSFGSTSSKIDDYPDLLAWGKNMYEDKRISFKSVEDFETNKKHVLIAIRNPDREFHYFQWHERFYWSNTDGAHHAAAIVRQVADQGLNFSLDCAVQYHMVSDSHLARLNANIRAVVVGRKNNQSFQHQCTSDLLFDINKLGVDFVYSPFPVGKSNDATIVLFDIGLMGASGSIVNKWIDRKIEEGIMLDLKTLISEWSQKKVPTV